MSQLLEIRNGNVLIEYDSLKKDKNILVPDLKNVSTRHPLLIHLRLFDKVEEEIKECNYNKFRFLLEHFLPSMDVMLDCESWSSELEYFIIWLYNTEYICRVNISEKVYEAYKNRIDPLLEGGYIKTLNLGKEYDITPHSVYIDTVNFKIKHYKNDEFEKSLNKITIKKFYRIHCKVPKHC